MNEALQSLFVQTQAVPARDDTSRNGYYSERTSRTITDPIGLVQYKKEKASGIRRPSGSLNLKRLKPKHLRIIDLHCLGISNNDIAEQESMSATYVSILLTDPLVVEQIKIRVSEAIAEFSALRGKAVDAVRTGLAEQTPLTTRLKAADMFFKVEGDYARASEQASKETAEDVIQRMLSLNLQVNVQTGERSEHRAQPSSTLTIEGSTDE